MKFRLSLLLTLLIPTAAQGQLRTPWIEPAGPHGPRLPEAAEWSLADSLPGSLPEPSPRLMRLRGQMFAGMLGGAAGAATTMLAWGALNGEARDYDFGPLLGGLLLGYPVGSAAGVYLHGGRSRTPARLLRTAAGAAVGVVAGTLVAIPTAGIGFAVGPPLGAALGFNLGR